jgi:Family of unknown function (DUF5906)
LKAPSALTRWTTPFRFEEGRDHFQVPLWHLEIRGFIIMDIREIARALGGDVSGLSARVPGPGHSAKDRSLSITPADNADGFICHSFAGDDPIECKEYIRGKLGLPAFKPNGHAKPEKSDVDIPFPKNGINWLAQFQKKAAEQQQTLDGKIVVAYDYKDGDGNLLYQNCRLEPKDFRQRCPDGKGGWTWSLASLQGSRVLYRLPELLSLPDATVFITEGEKDCNNVIALGYCATTVASHKWTDECVKALVNRDCWILEDNDDAGRKNALDAAKVLHGIAKSIRIIRLPGLGEGGDVSDWLAAGHTKQELEDVCYATPLWDPTHAPAPDDTVGVSINDFFAYMPMHQYIFAPTGQMWPSSSVNARVPPVPLLDNGKPVLTDDGKPKHIPASAWLDRNQAVEQMTWAPGQPMIITDQLISAGGFIERKGVQVFNQYRPPMLQHGDASQATPWLDHVRKVYPDQHDHLIMWLAHRVQRPQEKINHALVLGGKQGIGKDTLLEPVKRAVGPWNCNEVSPQQLMGRFNGFLQSVILRVNEARDLGEFDRYKFYDHSKAYITAPPDVLRVDEKHVKEYSILNVVGVVITTNHKTDGIHLPSDDRRHFVAWSELCKDDFTPAYWDKLWDWYEAGGYGHVAAYLAELDLSGFDPKAPPPKTQAFWEIVDASRAPEDAEMQDAIDFLGDPNPPALTITQLKRCPSSESFAEYLKDRKNSRRIPHRLEDCGYVAVRNVHAKDGLWKMAGGRQVIYARADLSIRDRVIAAQRLADELRWGLSDG